VLADRVPAWDHVTAIGSKGCLAPIDQDRRERPNVAAQPDARGKPLEPLLALDAYAIVKNDLGVRTRAERIEDVAGLRWCNWGARDDAA
jgi:hypothetical protein